MAYNVTFIPGDGVGPEVAEATRRVLEATGIAFYWDVAYAGASAMEKHGTPLPDYVLRSIRKNKVALKGPVTTPVGTGFRSVNVALRKRLDLFAGLRPCKTYPGTPTRYPSLDVVIVRENTEDLYSGIEFERGSHEAALLMELLSEKTHTHEKIKKNTGFSLKIISEEGTRRIVKFAFNFARAAGRKKVTAIHKANIMKFSDGLFLSVAREVARGYPDIEFEDVIVDTMCMRLVRTPELFDILVLPNLYGDFVSELCAGLVGGLGVAPGANMGREIGVFEPTHGSAPKYAGQNKVNPMAMMLSGVMMLRFLGEMEVADRVEKAIADVIAETKNVTYDLKSRQSVDPPVGTSEVADAVIEKLREG